MAEMKHNPTLLEVRANPDAFNSSTQCHALVLEAVLGKEHGYRDENYSVIVTGYLTRSEKNELSHRLDQLGIGAEYMHRLLFSI